MTPATMPAARTINEEFNMIRSTMVLLTLFVLALGVGAQESQVTPRLGVPIQAICNQDIHQASNPTRVDVFQSTQQHDLCASSANSAPVAAAAMCKKADDPDSSCKDDKDCCRGYSCVAVTGGKFCMKDTP